VAKSLVIGKIKPYRSMVAWEGEAREVATANQVKTRGGPDSIDGNVGFIPIVCRRSAGGVVLGEDKVTETEVLKVLENLWVEYVLVDVATEDDGITSR
jgi:hypothetical protein